jgi:hypothetical protein
VATKGIWYVFTGLAKQSVNDLAVVTHRILSTPAEAQQSNNKTGSTMQVLDSNNFFCRTFELLQFHDGKSEKGREREYRKFDFWKWRKNNLKLRVE